MDKTQYELLIKSVDEEFLSFSPRQCPLGIHLVLRRSPAWKIAVKLISGRHMSQVAGKPACDGNNVRKSHINVKPLSPGYYLLIFVLCLLLTSL